METKTCTKCKKEYPKTLEYFFRKTWKQKRSNGEIVIYKGFKSLCKSCHKKDTKERQIKKRCKEMGCELSEYRVNWLRQMGESNTKDLEAKKNLGISKYRNLLKLRSEGVGIDWKEYLKRSYENKHSKPWMRKFDYKGKKYLSKEDRQNMSNNHKIKNITDSYIYNSLGYKKGELSEEVIETKRNIIKLKRELGLTHSTKKK